MNKLAIIADTTQDLTLEMGRRMNIEIVPYIVQMDDQVYRDQVDLTSQVFYQEMESAQELLTAVPPVQEVMDCLAKVQEQGYDQALVITSSSKLTGMRQLYEILKANGETIPLTIFETDHIAIASGLFTLYAAELRNQGHSLNKIVAELERVHHQMRVFAVFRTLKYVIKGGRLNKYQSLLGTLLNINPLLTLKEGEITIIKKTRGRKRSYQLLKSTLQEQIRGHQNYKIALFGSANSQELKQLEADLDQEIQGASAYYVTDLTPVLGVHAGPLALGGAVMVLD